MIVQSSQEALKIIAQQYSVTQLAHAFSQSVYVPQGTVYSWINEGTIPRGLNHIRLRVGLELMGFTVAEYAHLPKLNRQVHKLVAFEVVSLDYLVQLLDLKNASSIYRFALRDKALQAKRMNALRTLVGEHEQDIERRFMHAQAYLEEIGVIAASVATEGGESSGSDSTQASLQSDSNEVSPVPSPAAASRMDLTEFVLLTSLSQALRVVSLIDGTRLRHVLDHLASTSGEEQRADLLGVVSQLALYE